MWNHATHDPCFLGPSRRTALVEFRRAEGGRLLGAGPGRWGRSWKEMPSGCPEPSRAKSGPAASGRCRLSGSPRRISSWGKRTPPSSHIIAFFPLPGHFSSPTAFYHLTSQRYRVIRGTSTMRNATSPARSRMASGSGLAQVPGGAGKQKLLDQLRGALRSRHYSRRKEHAARNNARRRSPT